MVFITLRYTGDQPGGIIHYGPGPDYFHPTAPSQYDFRGGQLVRIEDTDPRYSFYLDLVRNNPGMFEVVDQG